MTAEQNPKPATEPAPEPQSEVMKRNLLPNPVTFNDHLYNELTRRGWDLGEEEVADLIAAYEEIKSLAWLPQPNRPGTDAAREQIAHKILAVARQGMVPASRLEGMVNAEDAFAPIHCDDEDWKAGDVHSERTTACAKEITKMLAHRRTRLSPKKPDPLRTWLSRWVSEADMDECVAKLDAIRKEAADGK